MVYPLINRHKDLRYEDLCTCYRAELVKIRRLTVASGEPSGGLQIMMASSIAFCDTSIGDCGNTFDSPERSENYMFKNNARSLLGLFVAARDKNTKPWLWHIPCNWNHADNRSQFSQYSGHTSFVWS